MEESNGAQPLVIVSDRVFAGVDDEACPLGLLIEDGRIIETFPPEELDEHTPVGAEFVDFGDALVTAGLHDAHADVGPVDQPVHRAQQRLARAELHGAQPRGNVRFDLIARHHAAIQNLHGSASVPGTRAPRFVVMPRAGAHDVDYFQYSNISP